MPKSKRVERPGGKPFWPELEARLVSWVRKKRQEGVGISGSMIRLKAKVFALEMGVGDLRGGTTWCYRFMRRHDLVLRHKTRLSQKLPREFEVKILALQWSVICLRQSHKYEMQAIGNMDETPMTFDMPLNRTVDAIGNKTILVKTSGHEKDHFTVVLACLAYGAKLKPMVILKQKTMPKQLLYTFRSCCACSSSSMDGWRWDEALDKKGLVC